MVCCIQFFLFKNIDFCIFTPKTLLVKENYFLTLWNFTYLKDTSFGKKSCNFEHGLETKNEFEKWPLITFFQCTYRMPLMPPFPVERISVSAPFIYTGVDYLGPIYMKVIQKVWVCLYICLVTIAIYLEMMYHITTQQFLLSFRRFIARYGKPDRIDADNAAHFRLASNTI